MDRTSWRYCGIRRFREPTPMGHESCRIVDKVGSEVASIKPGEFMTSLSRKRASMLESAIPRNADDPPR
jgi:hypothetical protein